MNGLETRDGGRRGTAPESPCGRSRSKHPEATEIEPITVTATVPEDSPIADRFREMIE